MSKLTGADSYKRQSNKTILVPDHRTRKHLSSRWRKHIAVHDQTWSFFQKGLLKVFGIQPKHHFGFRRRVPS